MNPAYWLKHPSYFFNRIKGYTKNPGQFLLNTLGTKCPDKIAIKTSYNISTGKKLNLRNPVTFNDKLNWLKLYNRNPELTKYVDKIAAKTEVAKIIGEKYIVPAYGAWNSFDEIDFDSLPDRFVLKTNHDSGGIAICHSKATFDFEAAREKLTASLKRNYYDTPMREWAYKNVPPMILAEKYMEDGFSEPATPEGFDPVKFHAPEPGKRFADAGDGQLRDMVEKFRKVAARFPLTNPAIFRNKMGDLYGVLQINTRPADDIKNLTGILPIFEGWTAVSSTPPHLQHTIKQHNSTIILSLNNDAHELTDFKFLCCDGEAKMLQLRIKRLDHDAEIENYYDRDGNIINMWREIYSHDFSLPVQNPEHLAELFSLADKLAKTVPAPFMRNDFYVVNGKIYFGEVTLYPTAGEAEYSPDEWNRIFGDWITLPPKIR